MRPSKPLRFSFILSGAGIFTFVSLFTIVDSLGITSLTTDEKPLSAQSFATAEDYNQLSLFFHQTFGKTQTFSTAKNELLFQLTKSSHHEILNQTQLIYNGWLSHPTFTSEPHPFEVHYQITGESIIESIIQDTPLFPTHSTNTLFSIIPNKVVLKTPLKTETQWNECFIYNGIKHQATSIISNAWLDENDRRTYQVDTFVPTVDDSEHQPYFETRIYSEGIGLVFFKNNQHEYRLTN